MAISIKKGIVWRTSRQACLLCPWVRHLTGRLHFYVADRWPTRTSPGYNCEVANPACRKRRLRLVGGGTPSHSLLVQNGLPSFPSPNFNWDDGMNLNCRSCRTSIPRKRRGNHKQTSRLLGLTTSVSYIDGRIPISITPKDTRSVFLHVLSFVFSVFRTSKRFPYFTGLQL